ncbi:MAG: hypothetical protein ACJAT3_002177 [Akkermansiaceae bacterium]|jgi:hypothetical protein
MGLIVAAVVAGFSWRVVPMTILPRELGRNGELFSGREFYRFFTRWFHFFLDCWHEIGSGADRGGFGLGADDGD